MCAGLDICMGCLIWGILVSAGLGAVFSVSNLAYHIVRIVGAIYLFYLGIRLLFQPEKPALDPAPAAERSPAGALAASSKDRYTN
jgi:threonine/homoserine/homoserine lactone efflux protein